MNLKTINIYAICFVFALIANSGCSLAKKSAIKKSIKSKSTNYEALHNDLLNETLKEGTANSTIRELYGAPDDIFQSSSFEIWSYEKINSKGEPELWNPIRLYFEKGKLISWKY